MFQLIFRKWARLSLVLPSVLMSACDVQTERSIDVLPLNEVQYIGTHNSYKMHPDSLMIREMIRYELAQNGASNTKPTPSYERLSYGHPPLDVQLELGMRLFELDLHVASPDNPFSPQQAYQSAFGDDFVYEGGGFPDIVNDGRILVYHVRDHDYRSTCVELIDCLRSMAEWSANNPNHIPIIVYLEAKSNGGNAFTLTENGLVSGQEDGVFDLDAWMKVEADVESAVGASAVFRPSQMTSDGLSLSDSVRQNGWPSIADLRGKFLFVVAAGDDAAKDEYARIDDPLFFTFRPFDHPDAAFVIEFDPFSENIENIIEGGFIASTYADYKLMEARENRTEKRERLFEVGAQMISTDYPIRDPRLSDYDVKFPDGSYVRPRTHRHQD